MMAFGLAIPNGARAREGVVRGVPKKNLVQAGCKPLAVQAEIWCRPAANLSRCSPKIGADRLQTSRGAAPPWIVATCAAKRIGRHVSRSRSLGSSTHDSANRLLAAVSRVIPTGCHATRQPSRVGLHRERFAAGMQQIFFPSTNGFIVCLRSVTVAVCSRHDVC